MKTPRIAKAVSHIDEELISNAVNIKKTPKEAAFIKRSALAACFTVLLIVAAVAVPTFLKDGNAALPVVSGDNTTTRNSEITVLATNDESTTTSPDVSQNITDINSTDPTASAGNDNTTQTLNESTTQYATEAVYSEAYFYNVSEGEFSIYISGRVISEDKIDSKIDDVSVSAGWKNSLGEWLTAETLRAEVYLIKGVEKDVAVALKFIDKGDALTTDHYYVIMNPEGDLTTVKEYIIRPLEPNVAADEMGEETTVSNFAGDEIAVGHTSRANIE